MPAALLAALLLRHPGQGVDPRLQGAKRVDRDGWVAITVSGTPREMGYAHGALLAPEIDDTIKAVGFAMKEGNGHDWAWFRERAKTLYWDKIGTDLQAEMTGIAEGARSRGVGIDVWDVLAENAHIELGDYYIPWAKGQASDKQSCSAMVATGSQTADGRPVMAHNMWWDYRIGQRFRVLLDLRPEKGQRIVMDALPGFVHSGTDFAINGAGLMVTETTISGFAGYDPKGLPEFARMRWATQRATSLDEWARIMREGNNGGYANTWLLADAKDGRDRAAGTGPEGRALREEARRRVRRQQLPAGSRAHRQGGARRLGPEPRDELLRAAAQALGAPSSRRTRAGWTPRGARRSSPTCSTRTSAGSLPVTAPSAASRAGSPAR